MDRDKRLFIIFNLFTWIISLNVQANSCLQGRLKERLILYRPAKTVYFNEVKKFEEKPTRKRFKPVANSFKDQKIKFKKGTVQIDPLGREPIPVVELLGGDKTPFNRYIRNAKSIMGNPRIFVADLPPGTAGMASDHENVVLISRQMALDLQREGGDTLSHELRHILLKRYEDAGLDHVMHGKILPRMTNDQIPYMHKHGYEGYVSVSEGHTYPKELARSLSRYKDAFIKQTPELLSAKSLASKASSNAAGMTNDLHLLLKEMVRKPSKFLENARLQNGRKGVELVIDFDFTSTLGRKTPLEYTFPMPDLKDIYPQPANKEEAFRRISLQVALLKEEAKQAKRVSSFIQVSSEISIKPRFSNSTSQMENLGIEPSFIVKAYESALRVGAKANSKKTPFAKALKKLKNEDFPPKDEVEILKRFFKEGTSSISDESTKLFHHSDLPFTLEFSPKGQFLGIQPH